MPVADLNVIHTFNSNDLVTILGAKGDGFWTYTNPRKIGWVNMDADVPGLSDFVIHNLATLDAFGGFLVPNQDQCAVIGDYLFLTVPSPAGDAAEVYRFSTTAQVNKWVHGFHSSSGFPGPDNSFALQMISLGVCYEQDGSVMEDHFTSVGVRGKTRSARIIKVDLGSSFITLGDFFATAGSSLETLTSGFWLRGSTAAIRSGTSSYFLDVQINSSFFIGALPYRIWINGTLHIFITTLASTLYPGPAVTNRADHIVAFQSEAGKLRILPQYAGALTEVLADSSGITETLRNPAPVLPFENSQAAFFVNIVGVSDPDKHYGLIVSGSDRIFYADGQPAPVDICPSRSPIPVDQGTRIESGGLALYIIKEGDTVPDNPNGAGFVHVTGKVQRDERKNTGQAIQLHDTQANEAIFSIGMNAVPSSLANTLNPNRVTLRMLKG